jgi:hypothetical protein
VTDLDDDFEMELRCYRAFWVNGDVSFVFAHSREHCEDILDEIADPSAAQIDELDCHGGMGFHLMRKPSVEAEPGAYGWHLDELSESVADDMPPEALIKLREDEHRVRRRAMRILKHRLEKTPLDGTQESIDHYNDAVRRLSDLCNKRLREREERLRAMAALSSWDAQDPDPED